MTIFRKNSALKNLLIALIPYTEQNLLLTFKPKSFFYELEKSSGCSRRAINEAVRRAYKRGYIKERDGYMGLTESGRKAIQPYIASKIKNGKLMVIFDVPEDRSRARRQFRRLLQQWEFKQVQKSVWMTEYNHTESVKRAVTELMLDGFTELYECSLVFSGGNKS